MATEQYIIWFAHYGCLDGQLHSGPLASIVNWVAGMDTEDFHDCDDHGIPEALELVGSGPVEGFWDMVDMRREELRAERERAAYVWQQRQAERDAHRAETGEKFYRIRLKPPTWIKEKHLRRIAMVLASQLPMDELIVKRDELEAVYGRDRILVEECA